MLTIHNILLGLPLCFEGGKVAILYSAEQSARTKPILLLLLSNKMSWFFINVPPKIVRTPLFSLLPAPNVTFTRWNQGRNSRMAFRQRL